MFPGVLFWTSLAGVFYPYLLFPLILIILSRVINADVDKRSITPKVSMIIAAYNEEESLPILIEQMIQTFKKNSIAGEIIIVNDGSTDRTGKIADEIGQKYAEVRVIDHKRRRGKTAALLTGFRKATGDVLGMIDADLQYTSEDLPRLLEQLAKGYDLVNGWRRHRKDSIFKKIPSALYNLFSRFSFGLTLHDYNSGFKVLRREVFEDINPKRGQHRFIVVLAHHMGYTVGEIEIQHSPRKYGITKFGSSRIVLGLLDLFSLRLQLSFMERPIVLFGLSGIILLILGFIFGIQVIIWNLFYGEPFTFHFARLLLAAAFVIAGIQSFLFGFIADMIANLRAELRHNRRLDR